MRAVVVYESMYGNTHEIANAIGEGLRDSFEVVVVPVADADAALVGGADLLVVGGPTHVHGMSRPSTRKAAREATEKPKATLTLDTAATGPGVRDWLVSLCDTEMRAAAFDTRLQGPPFFTGRASKGIAKQLRERGCSLIAEPESFLVTKQTHLLPDQAERARRWGASLAALLTPTA